MDITVEWMGAEVHLALQPVMSKDHRGVAFAICDLLRATIGASRVTLDRRTRRIDHSVYWDAELVGPDCFSDEYPPTLRGSGDTAQAALDMLAERLRELAGWCSSVLRNSDTRVAFEAGVLAGREQAVAAAYDAIPLSLPYGNACDVAAADIRKLPTTAG